MAFVAVKSLSRVWFFCDPIDYNAPGCSVHGISQARILELVAVSSSGIFLTQGWNLHLLHGQADSFTSEAPGKPALWYRSLQTFKEEKSQCFTGGNFHMRHKTRNNFLCLLPLSVDLGAWWERGGKGIKKRQEGCRVRELEKARFGKRNFTGTDHFNEARRGSGQISELH